ncbi:MAG: hypothetical protein U1E66_06680 [Rhodospirillales bacterium]
MLMQLRSTLMAIASILLLTSPTWAQQAVDAAPAAESQAGRAVEGVFDAEGRTPPLVPAAPDEGLAAPAAAVSGLVYLCDNTGRLGTFDLKTKKVTIIGSMGTVLTDIGFHPNGTLYGVTFSQFYKVNPTTAKLTKVGGGLGSVGGINALTFNKAGQVSSQPQGFAASVNRSGIYLINPANGTIKLGYSVTPSQFSAGDFAFSGTHLYLSTSNRLLVDFNFANSTFTSHPVSIVNLYGLVVPAQGQLIGFAGTKAYQINPNTGASSQFADFTNKGLSQIFGAALKKFF